MIMGPYGTHVMGPDFSTYPDAVSGEVATCQAQSFQSWETIQFLDDFHENHMDAGAPPVGN